MCDSRSTKKRVNSTRIKKELNLNCTRNSHGTPLRSREIEQKPKLRATLVGVALSDLSNAFLSVDSSSTSSKHLSHNWKLIVECLSKSRKPSTITGRTNALAKPRQDPPLRTMSLQRVKPRWSPKPTQPSLNSIKWSLITLKVRSFSQHPSCTKILMFFRPSFCLPLFFSLRLA